MDVFLLNEQKVTSFVNSIYSTFGGEPPSETRAGAWLECITDEIWNKTKRKKTPMFSFMKSYMMQMDCMTPDMPSSADALMEGANAEIIQDGFQ